MCEQETISIILVINTLKSTAELHVVCRVQIAYTCCKIWLHILLITSLHLSETVKPKLRKAFKKVNLKSNIALDIIILCPDCICFPFFLYENKYLWFSSPFALTVTHL